MQVGDVIAAILDGGDVPQVVLGVDHATVMSILSASVNPSRKKKREEKEKVLLYVKRGTTDYIDTSGTAGSAASKTSAQPAHDASLGSNNALPAGAENLQLNGGASQVHPPPTHTHCIHFVSFVDSRLLL